MAVDKQYSCDLCGGVLPSEFLAGLHFVRGGIESRPAQQCNHHVCDQCLRSLAVIAKETETKAEG